MRFVLGDTQGRIQDFVRGGAKPSDAVVMCFNNNWAFVHSSSHLHTLKQAKNR